ncbi:MAG: diphosphomevalonate decarboxylase [Polyangiaceae bacterium]
MKASAVAHPNIALAKYWGKQPGADNVPAVPSLSVTLAGMQTKTTVELDPSLREDELIIGGSLVAGPARRKGVKVLDLLRRRATGPVPFARVVSENDFPTASGLASSASGMAALAVAGAGAYGLSLDAAELSSIAREGSASAARSLFGGYVELVPGHPAAPVASPSRLPLRVIVCVVSEAAKETSSTDGMTQTQAASPYYSAWTAFAPQVFADLKAALLAGDFERVGELAESSALAMHASAMAAGVIYFREPTYEVYREVKRLRREGLAAYATMDAGPHVKVLTKPEDAPKVSRALASVPGVLRLIEASPGPGATRLA